MGWFEKFFGTENKKNTAANAKERLKVLVATQSSGRDTPPYMAKLREEILAVVRKYVQVADSSVDMKVQRKDGIEILEMDITLPDEVAPPKV